MNVILLSGGSGKRLWPLSNEVRSKQFIKLFKTQDGRQESMVQRVYRQIRQADPDAKIIIATSKAQVSAIRNQLEKNVSISVEPRRRDTFPAIALACAYLYDVQGVSPEEPVVVCPVDPYVDGSYFHSLKRLSELAITGDANLVLMGMQPTYPSEKYGYILPEGAAEVSKVLAFKEKPDVATAQDYIEKGGLWNGGVFAFRLQYVLDKAHESVNFTDYQDLYTKYQQLPRISFDYAVVEQEPDIQVLRFAGEWKDIGTWNTITEAMDGHSLGEAVLHESCENVHILNELNVPVLALGLHDVIISASPQGILVSDKGQSSHIKPLVDSLEQQVMYAEKSWGSYQVLDVEDSSLTIKVTLKPGHSMNYHSHQFRDEAWVVIAGEGRVILDGKEKLVQAGDIVSMKARCPHTVLALSELKMVEVQFGKEISGEDKTVLN
ncbi:cupin domain-containing protein [Neglecta sp. X4]|jgi:mannose-1-phosphate guanylyltransferase|uniref:sugar phosphate nucleotidyltransferase n=1 Tax=unclassified Neglectibacter TaxID=2632164 RepID=UPI00136AC6B4|nr:MULTISPECIES: sugar phosphate nucleotidyltransferase [unclassified Neglectibacter]NBI18029.1 cupin domain-containing protein [Neglectibacter sp. 59]NBJ73706.1 cupin domain-containing protein [Neglectibacter sp. X4]NCE81639.1 cupin domain-containing protein [Neglectibacter sp. X58]